MIVKELKILCKTSIKKLPFVFFLNEQRKLKNSQCHETNIGKTKPHDAN